MRSAPLYRGLTLLYPREFRHRYRDDLIQHHADLTRDRGRAAAWSRSGLDLIVTIPRYALALPDRWVTLPRGFGMFRILLAGFCTEARM